MEPLRLYDYLTLARGALFDQVRPLSMGQYSKAFEIGPGAIDRTLTHIMISEWYYVQRLHGRDVPPYAEWPIRQEDPPPFAIVESTWAAQAVETRAALGAVGDWQAVVEYDVTTDEGRRERITTTPADIVTQLILHETHHRAQVMNMVRRLGVEAPDLDFNALMYERRAV